MNDIQVGFVMAGFCLGMLVGVLVAKGVECYRKNRGWHD